MTTAIPKNHTRKITLVREQATVCHVFSLSDNFEARPCEPGFAWDHLARSPHARLTVNDAGDEWTVTVHGNLWYRLRKPAEAVEAPPPASPE